MTANSEDTLFDCEGGHGESVLGLDMGIVEEGMSGPVWLHESC